MILRPVRTSQPQGLVRIDWSNPITRGLISYIDNAASSGELVKIPSRFGVALRSQNSTGNGLVLPTAKRNTSQGTLMLLADFKENLTYGEYFWDGVDSGNRDLFYLLGPDAGSNSLSFGWYVNSVMIADNNAEQINAGFLSDGAVFLSWTGSVQKAHKNGVVTQQWARSIGTGPERGVRLGSRFNATDNLTSSKLVQRVEWDRTLSDAEIKSLTANPWQIFAPDAKSLWVPDTVSAGGGATTISSDASASYAIRAAIASDAAASYPVRSATSSDTTAAYPLRAATQSDTAAAYAIRSAVSADALASYYVLGLVQSDTAGSYAVRAAAQSDALASYAIRSAVQSEALASYEILSAGVVFSDSPASYAIRSAVQADGAASYTVRSVAQADAAGAYAVRSAVWADAGASYAVQGALVAVWADATASYFVDGVVASGVYPIHTTVLAGVQYGPTGVEYTGTLTIGSTGPTAAEIAEALLAGLNPATVAQAVWSYEQ